MKNFYLLAFSLLFTTTLSAQAEISATVMDTTGTTLPGANAVLLRAQDSLLTAFGTTDDKGVFLMQNVPAGKYLLRVTFLGYERPDQTIDVTDDDQYFGLGEIKMYPAGFFLNGVEVTADRIPIRMKGDTMMYNADAFAVGENAVVEDLLRRLPGMAVDASGQITWRGKPISEVMINGKPFFAGNSTLLTQNLDAKSISNVEVYDQKTDAEEVSGVDDGAENMTVNLEMKDEFKAKVFGELYAGYGTEERYQAGGKTFRISDVQQIGLLGTINNVNKVGFSGDEISGFNGSSGRGRSWGFSGGDGSLPFDDGNASGQNRSLAAGVNYGRSLGKDGQLTLDYALFDRTQVQAATSLQAFNRTNDRRIVETMEGSNTSSYSHRIGFELRQKLDTLARLRVEGSASLIGGENNNLATTQIRREGTIVDDYTVNEFNENEQPRGDISVRYNRGAGGRRSFMGPQTANRTFGLNAGASFRMNQSDLNLLTEGLEEGTSVPGALINGTQVQDRRTDSYSYEIGADFAEPLGEKWRLRLDADAELDRDEGNYNFRVGEDRTANLIDRDWMTLKGAASLIRQFGKGSNVSFGSAYAANTLKTTGDAVRDENFNFLLPFVRLRLRMKKGFFSANINSSSRAPSITQLQTIAQPNTSGRVSIGNPDLIPAVNTRFNSFMWFNDQFRAISANFNVNLTYTDNAFGNAITFTRGQQIYQTVNVGHAWSGGLYGGTTIGMNFINGEFRVQANVNGSRGQGFVDDVSKVNTSITTGIGANITSELNEDSYIKVGYDLNRFVNSFDDDTSPTTGQTTHSFLGQFELEVSPKWRFESRFLYSIFAANEFAAEQNIPDLRLSLELRPFRKKGHFLRISASDLFNQNTIIRRSVQPFVTTETTADGLGRYFLATFHYKL